MENKVLPRLDWSTSFLVAASLIAFSFIHDYDGKGPIPLLIVAIMGLVAAPFSQKLPCFLLLMSWLSLWLVVFKPSPQKNWILLLMCLGIQWTELVQTYNRYAQYGTVWPVTNANEWFWLPAIIFMLLSAVILFNVSHVIRLANKKTATSQKKV